MTATTVDRQTIWQHTEREIVLPLKSGETIPSGVMVCSDANGEGVNGSDTANLKIEGVSTHSASYAAGDRSITVRRGSYWFANNGNVLQSHKQTLVTIVDNQTVGLAADTTQDIGAGYVDAIHATRGVLVTILGGKPAAA